MEKEDERALLDAARTGDARALDELLARYEKPVYRFGLRMCGTEEAARDVLQETLLAAFRSIRDFRGDARLSTWLFQIARSFCIKSRRRRVDAPAEHAPLESEALAVASSGSTPEEHHAAGELAAVLQAAIGSLSDPSREVLILRDVEGLSAEEAAAVIGIEVPALKSRLHRARQQLRNSLTVLLNPAASGPCAALSEELADFAMADIDQATCARIEQHLAGCARCAEACSDLQRTVSLCRRIPGDEVPAPVRAAVRRALGTIQLAPPE